jgi:peptidoglycan/LPS O-acetylase OafA/YrhL
MNNALPTELTTDRGHENIQACRPFDHHDTHALKAIGICAIVLHNFYHFRSWALPVGFNEFDFNPARIFTLLQAVLDPFNAVQGFFTYFGHFGVQPFIFFSAYGLACGYWNPGLAWWGFLRGRIQKLYPMWFLVMGLWLVLLLAREPTSWIAQASSLADDLFLTTIGIISLVPGYGLPPVGPWWFLAFIVQFYCLWPKLATFARAYGARGLFLVALGCQLLTMGFNVELDKTLQINLLETPIGHMPEIALGIAMARFDLRIGHGLFVVAFTTFLLSNFFEWAWTFTFISALVMLLYMYCYIAPVLRNRSLLERISAISMPLFFVNGFLRGPFLAIGARAGNWLFDLVIGGVYLIFCIGVARGLQLFEQRLRQRRRDYHA